MTNFAYQSGYDDGYKDGLADKWTLNDLHSQQYRYGYIDGWSDGQRARKDKKE